MFSIWSLVFGLILRLGSRDSVQRVPRWIRDFPWNTLELAFLNLNFLASCSLQQFQAKFKVTKFMTCHRRIPLKIKPRLFISYLNKANGREKFDYWDGRKNLLFFVSLVWWHGCRDYRDFSKQSPWSYWPRKLFILTSWGAGKKLNVNRMLLIKLLKPATKLPIDNLLGDFKIELILFFWVCR